MINKFNYVGNGLFDFEGMKFNGEQAYQLDLGIYEGIDVSFYKNPNFDELQMEQIRTGLKEGLNVNFYAYTECDVLNMIKMRKVLKIVKKQNIDISKYQFENLTPFEVFAVAFCTREGLNMDKYLKKGYSYNQIICIVRCLKSGVNLNDFDLNKLNNKQLQVLPNLFKR